MGRHPLATRPIRAITRPGDTFTNVDADALDEMTDAIAHVILTFAMTTSAVQGTDKGSDKATYGPDIPRAARIK